MKFWKLASAATALVLSTSVNAALVGRLAVTEGGTDYQAYYDTEADLTWLADANAAGAIMNWADANNWAAGLTINGIGGWRLPDTLQPDTSCSEQIDKSYGHNCTGSEMGNLFYNTLGNTAGILDNNYGPFSNIGFSPYWSSTEYAPDMSQAWVFIMLDGNQSFSQKGNFSNAWAVQSGDVAPVPVPAAVWLFGSGLIGLVGFAKRKKA